MKDVMRPYGVFESWLTDKKTGKIIPGSYLKELNTVGYSTLLFLPTLLNSGSSAAGFGGSSGFFSTDENDYTNIDGTWLTSYGNDGIVYISTLPTDLETTNYGTNISLITLLAACKTVATSVGLNDDNKFVITGQLNGEFVNSTGRFALVKDLAYVSAGVYTIKGLYIYKQQSVNISASRAYNFKWTVTF